MRQASPHLTMKAPFLVPNIHHMALSIYVKMGICYYYLKDKDNALKYFNYALEDDEDYVDEARPYLIELRGY